jgi:hypothetical protein
LGAQVPKYSRRADSSPILSQSRSPWAFSAHWACVREDRWRCYALPVLSLDEVHPGLTPTEGRLSPQAPSIFSISTAPGALAIEWHRMASSGRSAPNFDLAGAWVELLRLRPDQTAERRGLLDLRYGRRDRPPLQSVPHTHVLSPHCLQVTRPGKRPDPIFVAPGRYCVGTDGRLLLKRW